MPDDLLETVKAALDAEDPYDCINYGARETLGWLRALVARCELAEADLAAARAEAARLRELLARARGYVRECVEANPGSDFASFASDWLNEARAALEADHDR